MDPPSRSWSIYTRSEITSKYEIQDRIGSGSYSDVYRARRISDDLTVALKEIHDYQSAFREIEALQILQNSANVVVLIEFFWQEEEDAVLVLEYLKTDLASVIREAKRSNGLSVGEIKRWMIQILHGVDACHRNAIVHRDLKPSNLLISADGVLKLADFGQARILLQPEIVSTTDSPRPLGLNTSNQVYSFQPPEDPPETKIPTQEEFRIQEYFRELDELKFRGSTDGTDKETNFQDGNASCLATCTTSDVEDDAFKGSYSYEAEDGGDDNYGPLTSCVGTRWFRAPELLYGSTNYGPEVDLWSLGCIFAELLSLEPLFPGISDVDQLSRILSVLGNLTEETFPGCSNLPDYKSISFNKIENPIGLETYLPKRYPDEIRLVGKLVCYDPASRATAMELLHDRYLNEEPLPVPISELRVPAMNSGEDEDSPGAWRDYRGMDSDSDFDDFGPVNVTTTGTGFSVRFP